MKDRLPPIVFTVPTCQWKDCAMPATAFLEHHRNFLDGTKEKTGEREGYCIEHAKMKHAQMIGSPGYEAETFKKPNRL